MSKKLRRMSAVVTAFCIAAAMAVSFGNVSITAGASANLPGDLNGDGDVTSIDASILQSYLFGRCDITCHGAADLDYDGAITMADLSKLTKYLTGAMRLPTASNNITASNMESRSYVMHSYKTNSTTAYLLGSNVDNFSLEDGISTYANDNSDLDDRVKDSDSSVVQIASSGGTGFIIGDHLIATAAHCIYDKATGKFIDNLTVVLHKYNNSGEPVGTVSIMASEAHIPRKFCTDSVYSKYDFALIYVEEDLSEYGMFDLGIPSDEFMDSRTGITISGFPADVRNEHTSCEVLYKDDGVVLNINEFNSILFEHQIMTSAFTSGGDSGGPIYMTTNVGNEERHTVVGIHTSGGGRSEYDDTEYRQEYGVRITSSLLRFYYNNSYIGSSVN